MAIMLLVDDSETSRLLFKAHFPPDTGYEIHETGDTAAAFNMARSLQPDVIVLDYNMPVKNGAELARDMLDAGVQAKYVLLSANTQQSVVQTVNKLGFVAIIEKPINPDAIKRLLESV
jgi:CheY-like chemotaxis protein